MKLGVLRTAEGGRLTFWCPGCKEVHVITTGQGPGPRWRFNGNHEKPTFTPSVLVRTGRAVDPTFEPEPDDPPEICHSFVTDGQIRFLTDSTHHLAGQTVPLEPFDD